MHVVMYFKKSCVIFTTEILIYLGGVPSHGTCVIPRHLMLRKVPVKYFSLSAL
jgi:hypothetical protein